MKYNVNIKKLSEVADLTVGFVGSMAKHYVDEGVPFLRSTNIRRFKIDMSDIKYISPEFNEKIKKSQLREGDVVIVRTGMPGACTVILKEQEGWNCSDLVIIHPHKEKVLPLYIAAYVNYSTGIINANLVGAVQQHFNVGSAKNMEIAVPSIEIQKKIVGIIQNINGKLDINSRINKNLEQQLSSIFANLFADHISDASIETCPQLGSLISVIDNRGKTPPLTTETFDYPIIDVGVLKGSGRIIDFNNCTKYVDENTYNMWFRSGHPQAWDILLSTVGSLAEMKIYLGSKGCMAQNVVALRPVSISPLYLYQYLKYIRSDLVAYNIGSVQPSIKVTHIIKHPIYIPDVTKLKLFEKSAKAITEQIYANCNQNEILKDIRDALLPKLMSGELDVSNLDL